MEKKVLNTFRSLDPAGLKFLENKSKTETFSCRKTITYIDKNKQCPPSLQNIITQSSTPEKQVAGKVSKLTKKEESEACVHLNRDIGDNSLLRQG